MRAGLRGLIAAAALCCALAGSPDFARAAPACGSYSDAQLTLNAPPTAAVGRTVDIGVSNSGTEAPTAANLDLRRATDGALLYGHAFTAKELSEASDQFFPVLRFAPGAPAAFSILRYDTAYTDYSNGGAKVACSGTAVAKTTPTAGERPVVEFENDAGPEGDGVRVSASPPNKTLCAQTAPGDFSIVITRGRKRMRSSTPFCTERAFRTRGRFQEFRLTESVTAGGDYLRFNLAGGRSFDRVYGVSLMLKGRTVAKRWLVASRDYYPSRVIDQDEDDFQNVCINRALEIYSAGGELYCVEPAEAFNSAGFQKKKPREKSRRKRKRR